MLCGFVVEEVTVVVEEQVYTESVVAVGYCDSNVNTYNIPFAVSSRHRLRDRHTYQRTSPDCCKRETWRISRHTDENIISSSKEARTLVQHLILNLD